MQYTLSNMIYIKLQNYCFFFFEMYFEGRTPKTYTNQLNDDCNGVHFFFFFDKIASLQVFFKIFDQICTVVIYKEFFEILRTSVSQKTF